MAIDIERMKSRSNNGQGYKSTRKWSRQPQDNGWISVHSFEHIGHLLEILFIDDNVLYNKEV